MSDQKKELLLRAEAKIKQLQAKLAEIKVDAQSSKNEEKDKLEKQVLELTETIKQAGENFSESLAKKINDWLK
ncbi:hypothetical protein N9O57_01705 [bacterium]|nr:hypothetical protein [bacterium]